MFTDNGKMMILRLSSFSLASDFVTRNEIYILVL